MPSESAENIRASLRAIRIMNLVLLWTVVTFTAIVQAQDDRPGIPPPAPTEFRCTGITSTTATVSWLPSRDDLQYKLSWQRTSSVLVNSTRLLSNRTSYMIINLDPGTKYRLMINSINTENNKESLTISITMKTLVEVDGQWGPFGSWSSCSKTCGGGKRTRERKCNDPPPSNGGKDCKGKAVRQRSCNENACPVVNGWGSWTNWSSCSKTCGGGQKTRKRFCVPSEGISDCDGYMEHKVVCNNISCPVNGGWGSWLSWSLCSVTCGGGQMTRQRLCNNPPPSGGGRNCSGNSSQQQDCSSSDCPVNGQWGPFSSWSSCSQTCGGGMRTRQQECNNPPPSNGGLDCVGSGVRQRRCNTDACPVDGQWGPFGNWSTCSQACGGGTRTRQRECNNPPPSNGGLDCVGNTTQELSCNADVCPPVNGQWGQWTNWSSCSDGGVRSRQRVCDNPSPSNGGLDCSGNATHQENCNPDACSNKTKSTRGVHRTKRKDDFFRASGGHHSDQVQAVCHFDSGGVSGTVHLLQRRRNSQKTKVGVQLEGLDGLPGDDEYGLCITEFTANLNLANPCAAAVVGDVYNPEGVDMSVSDYPARCQGDHSQCAIGDLATRHSELTGNDSGVFVEYRDNNLNLYGPNTVVGRAMTLKRLDTDETLSCCNIIVPTNERILRAQYDDGTFRGEITMTVPQYDYLDYTKNKNTIIMVDLQRIDGGPTNVSMLGWQIQRGYADETCSNLDSVLGPPSSTVLPGDSDTRCSQTYHRECRLGDLTTKCGPLQLENNRIRAQCTDNMLGLTSFSTIDQTVLSITDQSGTILDCAQLNEQMSAGGYVIFGFNGGYANIAFSQLTPYDPTMYRSYVIGLNGQAGNIVVYDGPDCDNLGNVLDYPGNLPTANPVTSDQYPVGELGPKLGGVMGKDYLRTQGLSSNIPLTGPVNVLDKPIAVLYKNGSVWGCGMVEDYYNMPYNPPTDVFDYLDLWRPPVATVHPVYKSFLQTCTP